MKKDSAIFIAGHKGLVGSAVLRYLKSKDYKKLITVDRKKLENRRSQKLSYAPQSLGAKSIYLGAGLVTSFFDPINIKSLNFSLP